MTPKDTDVSISAGTCGKMRANCRTWNLTVIGILVTIAGLVIMAIWSDLGKAKDAVASLQQESAGQKATIQAIKENTDEIKQYLMERNK